MKTQEARELGKRLAGLVAEEQIAPAYDLLAPVLADRTPFNMLRRIGAPIGAAPIEQVNPFLEHIAAFKTEGGWVVIAAALEQQLDRDRAGSLERSREFVIAADVWYAPGMFGEGVIGPSLIGAFEPTLELIAPWREDENGWVRRSIGHGVTLWAKRSKGAPELGDQAQALLDFLDPLFEERDMDALKGIGWGLKTLGKYYPDLMAAWLVEQVVVRQRPHRALMLRKALTYLPEEQRARVTGAPA